MQLVLLLFNKKRIPSQNFLTLSVFGTASFVSFGIIMRGHRLVFCRWCVLVSVRVLVLGIDLCAFPPVVLALLQVLFQGLN